MRLYHFTSQKFGLLAIQSRRLKIARINELNDPFEFLGWNLQDPETRAKLRNWKEKRNAELGILCFSRKWSNPLLWGHYAAKHQGVAIGFDVPDDDLYSPVKYRSTRMPTPMGRDMVEADVESLLLTKFSAWRYESEYRCFCRLDQSTLENGLYFEPFSATLKLAEIIVGDQSTITRAELAAAIGDQHPHVTTFKARPAFRTFSVVRNRDGALWK
jgi:hypothetical protein